MTDTHTVGTKKKRGALEKEEMHTLRGLRRVDCNNERGQRQGEDTRG